MKWLVVLVLLPCLLAQKAAGQEVLKALSKLPEMQDVNVQKLMGNAPELKITITIKNANCAVNDCKTNPIRDCSCFEEKRAKMPHGFNVEIQPSPTGPKFKVFCSVRNNQIWTVIQERLYGNKKELAPEGFNRDFAQYQKGFGKLSGNHFMGLDNLHQLTQAADMKMEVVFFDANYAKKVGQFSSFKVAGSAENYRLSLGGPGGEMGSKLMPGNGQPFSAKGKDVGGKGCPAAGQAGWWYPADCGTCTLTGPWEKTMCSGTGSKGVSLFVTPK